MNWRSAGNFPSKPDSSNVTPMSMITTRRATMSDSKVTGYLAVLAATMILGGCLTGGEADEPALATAPGPGPDGNTSPIIFGNPSPAVLVGDSYSFTPEVLDPDDDTLTFSIENQPSWINFNEQTGKMSGVAELGMEGVYPNIRITVSDGSATANLPAFDIEITQIALGSATLNWTPPTQNEDGTPLTNLAGYRIYYGTQSGNYTRTVTVPNPGLSTYTIDSLTPDTYYFVSTAVNTLGEESTYSNETTKTVL